MSLNTQLNMNVLSFQSMWKKTFAEFPAREKDKTIDSMLKQIKLKTYDHGKRIKYWHAEFTSITSFFWVIKSILFS